MAGYLQVMLLGATFSRMPASLSSKAVYLSRLLTLTKDRHTEHHLIRMDGWIPTVMLIYNKH